MWAWKESRREWPWARTGDESGRGKIHIKESPLLLSEGERGMKWEGRKMITHWEIGSNRIMKGLGWKISQRMNEKQSEVEHGSLYLSVITTVLHGLNNLHLALTSQKAKVFLILSIQLTQTKLPAVDKAFIVLIFSINRAGTQSFRTHLSMDCLLFIYSTLHGWVNVLDITADVSMNMSENVCIRISDSVCGVAGSYGIVLCLIYWGHSVPFSTVASPSPFDIPTSNAQGFQLLYNLTKHLICFLLLLFCLFQ